MSGAVEMIHFGQKIYLISRMAVDNFPENFAAYGDSLSWTMMDIRTPWRESNEPEEDKELEVLILAPTRPPFLGHLFTRSKE